MKNNHKSLAQNRILRPLLVAASIIFFFSTITFIIVFTDNFYTASYDKEIFYHYINAEDYNQLYKYTCGRRSSDHTSPDKDFAEIYAVADYYHASYLYHAYQNYNSELAKKYETQMEQSSKNAGELHFAIENIDAYFETYK